MVMFSYLFIVNHKLLFNTHKVGQHIFVPPSNLTIDAPLLRHNKKLLVPVFQTPFP